MTMRISVEWDTYDEDEGVTHDAKALGLPSVVDVPNEVVAEGDPDWLEEDVCEWLSDTYGWLVDGWALTDAATTV
jgi:hypothetical protein